MQREDERGADQRAEFHRGVRARNPDRAWEITGRYDIRRQLGIRRRFVGLRRNVGRTGRRRSRRLEFVQAPLEGEERLLHVGELLLERLDVSVLGLDALLLILDQSQLPLDFLLLLRDIDGFSGGGRGRRIGVGPSGDAGESQERDEDQTEPHRSYFFAAAFAIVNFPKSAPMAQPSPVPASDKETSPLVIA